MTNLLEKLNLKVHFTITLKMDKDEFVEKLKSITDNRSTNFFFDGFDFLYSSNNELKGRVDSSGFKIKKKREFFDNDMCLAVATGSFKEKNGQLIIRTEINGLNEFVALFLLVGVIVFSLMFFDSNVRDDFGITALILHASFMLIVLYFLLAVSVSKLKEILEKKISYFLPG